MPSTNEPRTITTREGPISVEVEIIESARRRRQVPIVDVQVNILPGHVKNPEILFEHAFRESYAAATNFMHVPPHPNTDTVRMVLFHPGLTNHGNVWSSATYAIGNDSALREILKDWEDAMQSGEEVDLSTGSLRMQFQYVLSQSTPPPPNRVGGTKRTYHDRQTKMWNRVNIEEVFIKDKTLLQIPPTEQQLCFIMAFISSQCRYFKVDRGMVTDVMESGCDYRGQWITNKEPHILLPCPIDLFDDLRQHLPCLLCDQQIMLFNTYAFPKELNMTVKQHDLWIQVCLYIHEYVEEQLHHPVNKTDLKEIVEAYSRLFGVLIHIRRLELQGNRYDYFLLNLIQHIQNDILL